MGKGAIRTYENIRVKSGVLLLWLKAGKRCYLVGENQCSADRPCTAVQLLVQRVESESERMDKVEKLVESLRNRLPLWATLSLTAAGGMIGLLAGHVKF